MEAAPDSKFLLDPYLDWAKGEAVPVVDAVAVNLHRVETGAWPRLGSDCKGALVHLEGRGDFLALHLIDILPGGRSAWLRHMYDDVYYVLSGHGSVQVERRPGAMVDFEFGPHSLFAPPLNAPHRFFNASGSEKVRLVSANNAPLWINLAHDERFVFDNAFVFESRAGQDSHYAGDGAFIAMTPGKHMWETNFVADLAAFELRPWERRGAGSSNIKFILADSVMHAHCSEMAVGTYKTAHRHGPGAHVLAVTGAGYTLTWYEGDRDFLRHEWSDGCAFAPADGMFHQHFNTGPAPARYLACSLGSHRYPVTAAKRRRKENPDKNAQDGGLQIAYADQDPRIHPMWLADIAENGVSSKMGHIFAETEREKKVS